MYSYRVLERGEMECPNHESVYIYIYDTKYHHLISATGVKPMYTKKVI